MSHEEVVKEFIDKKLSSKWWRLNNLYTIKDKWTNINIMTLNGPQEKTLRMYRHNKKIILKGRQQGISTLYLAYNLDDCLTLPGFEAGIQSYGEDESMKLAERAKLMWDKFNPEIKELLGIELRSSNKTGLYFSNGSSLRIGNFRGDTLQSLHVSELAKIAKKYPEKAKELKTGAFQSVATNNSITVESTAEGKYGLFYEMWVKAESLVKADVKLTPLDFQPVFLPWYNDLDCNLDMKVEVPLEINEYLNNLEKELNKEKPWYLEGQEEIKFSDTQRYWYAKKTDELGEDMKQEYPSTPEEAFAQSIEGTYYKEEYKRLKLGRGLYDPNLLVHSTFDLGMNDTFSIIFWQKQLDDKIRYINYYSNNGQGLEHYRDVFVALSNKHGYVYGSTYVPHDVKVRELISGRTRWSALKELGFNPVLVKRHTLQDGIQATREHLPNVIIDVDACQDVILAIQNYRKGKDDRLGVFLSQPIHDEFSHSADAVRYTAMGDKYKPQPSKSFNSRERIVVYESSESSQLYRPKNSGYDI